MLKGHHLDKREHVLMCLALACLVLVGAASRYYLVTADLGLLVEKTLPDDAFYYFQIVRNIRGNLGPSLDGEHLTNGFHPLWAIVLLPGFLFTPDPLTPIRIALAIGAGCSLLTGVFIYLMARTLGVSTLAALIPAGYYLTNPGITLLSVNGLETSLALLFFASTILAFFYLRSRPWSERGAILLGSLSGLTFLARTDYVLFPLLLSVHVATYWGRRYALVFTSAVAGVVAPWFLWITTFSPG